MCDYCDDTGQIEMDNNGPIVDCPLCGTLSARPAGYKATTDKNKLSGCEHEDGSGWCTAGVGVVCEDANHCPDGSIGCNRAL